MKYLSTYFAFTALFRAFTAEGKQLQYSRLSPIKVMKIFKANMINIRLIQDDHNLFYSCVTLLMPFISLASIETGC